MNQYHKCIQELGKTLPGWIKIGAVALSMGVGTEGIPVPRCSVGKLLAGKTKKDTEHIHTTTVNVALQNRCFNFENASVFLPKMLLFVLPTVALLYFVRKKSKPDNKG